MPEFIELPGARLECHARASSSDQHLVPVVLLHPWFGCWQFWRRTIQALPEFATYAVDLYSLGAGQGWRDYASPSGIAQAVEAMLDRLGLDRCSIVGNSMGGIAAQVLSAKRPHRIEKLVLVGTGARTIGLRSDYRESVEDWIAGRPNGPTTEQLVSWLLARRPADPREFATFVGMLANANKQFMSSVLNHAFALDLRPILSQITATTLVVRGELDAARTRAHVEELLSGIRCSRSVEIPGAGHSPQVDSPEAFGQVVREFLLGDGAVQCGEHPNRAAPASHSPAS